MGEITGNAAFLQQFGVAALLFFVFYLYHKAVTKQQDKVMEMQSEREKENFSLLKDMISTNIIQNGLLEKIDSKITNNQFCPYVREFLNQGDKKNDAPNNAN